MGIAEFTPLLLVALIGLVWHVVLLAFAPDVSEIEEHKNRWGRIKGVVLNLAAIFVLITPLLIILWKVTLS